MHSPAPGPSDDSPLNSVRYFPKTVYLSARKSIPLDNSSRHLPSPSRNRRLIWVLALLAAPWSLLPGQPPTLRALDPVLGPAPDISVNAARNHARNLARWQRIDSLIATYPDPETAAKHLPKRQFAFWEQHLEGLPDDYLSIGAEGCSWYCGGGPDTVYASSFLSSNGQFTYRPDNAHDFSLRTAWVEGVPGAGIGQRLSFRFARQGPPVTHVELYNGYMKSEKAWRDNARIRQLRLLINGRPYALLNLRDTTAVQRFAIGSHQGVKRDLVLTFEIAAVYPGARYDDTALADVIFDGTGVHCFAAGTLVTMAGGAPALPIEQLRAGDRVLSLNEATGALEPAVVLETAVRRHHDLWRYDFNGRTIVATADHPFLHLRGGFAALDAAAAGRYDVGAVETLRSGTFIYCLENAGLSRRTFASAAAQPDCIETFTIVRLDRNRVFFANGLAVATEAIAGSDEYETTDY
jgi:hypothetical protein